MSIAKRNRETINIENAILINVSGIEPQVFCVELLQSAMRYVDLASLSRGEIQGSMPVVSQHPLTVVQNENIVKEGDELKARSKLPIVGVETSRISENEQTIGQSLSFSPVNKEFIEFLKQRYKDSEILATDKQIKAVEDEYNTRQEQDRELYVETVNRMEQAVIQIACWSTQISINRFMQRFLRSMSLEFMRSMRQHGVMVSDFDVQPSLYNFDFGEILYGTEMTFTVTYRNINYLIDMTVEQIKNVDIGVYNTKSNLFFRPANMPEHGLTMTGKMRFTNE